MISNIIELICSFTQYKPASPYYFMLALLILTEKISFAEHDNCVRYKKNFKSQLYRYLISRCQKPVMKNFL